MFDMMKMMGKVKEVQARMKEAQENLVLIKASAESGGGMVKATFGLVALGTLAAALLHGPALAGLGLVGAYVTPIISLVVGATLAHEEVPLAAVIALVLTLLGVALIKQGMRREVDS